MDRRTTYKRRAICFFRVGVYIIVRTFCSRDLFEISQVVKSQSAINTYIRHNQINNTT